MNLPKPSDIKLDGVTRAMLQDLEDLSHQVNEVRPLAADVLRQVKDELFGERVYSSNAIEGNTLTIRETRLILQTKTSLDIRKQREAQEAINLGAAAEQVERLLGEESAWHDVSSFLDVHELLMTGIYDSIAGRLRDRDVIITGAKRQPPGSLEVSDLIDQFFGDLSAAGSDVDGLTLATWAHWAIARIHPFVDGNGRLARLWQDLILLRSRLTVAIIRPQDRDTYLDALSQADEGDFNPLAQLVCQRVMTTLQVYVNAQEAADELQGWAAELVGETSARELERRKLDYLRWYHAVEQIYDAFDRCSSLIMREQSDISLHSLIGRKELIDQATWESLLAGGAGKRILFFMIYLRRHGNSVVFRFFFGRHNFQSDVEAIENQKPSVSLLLAEMVKTNQTQEVYLDHLEGNPMSLREILVLDRRIVRRRWDQATSQMVYDHEITAIEVAKDFFADVFLKVLA